MNVNGEPACGPMGPGRMRAMRVRAQIIEVNQTEGARVWARMHDTARQLLIGMATERDAEAAKLPWLSLTAIERDAIGAAARQLGRDLSGALWLR